MKCIIHPSECDYTLSTADFAGLTAEENGSDSLFLKSTDGLHSMLQSAIERTIEHIGWTPSTNVLEGAENMLAWHYHQAYPYGPPRYNSDSFEEENQFLRQHIKRTKLHNTMASPA
eukprot:10704060-Ditylum_brightwellii.AAC.1